MRATAETSIRVRLALDGAGRVASQPAQASTTTCSSSSRSTPASTSCSRAAGDLETGAHHTAEDAAIALGEALDRALGDRRGIARYGDAVVPMDDALARAAVDLGGRRGRRSTLERSPGLARHALESLAQSARIALHVSANAFENVRSTITPSSIRPTAVSPAYSKYASSTTSGRAVRQRGERAGRVVRAGTRT